MGAIRWGEELAWFFLWSGADLGERSAFPSGQPIGTGNSEVAFPSAQQCGSARRQRRIKRVLLTLNKQHQAVLETAYGPARETPPNLAHRFGITQRAAVIAWSMHRALIKLKRKVDATVAETAQRVLDEAHALYEGARQADELANPKSYPRSKRSHRRDRVQAFRTEIEEHAA